MHTTRENHRTACCATQRSPTSHKPATRSHLTHGAAPWWQRAWEGVVVTLAVTSFSRPVLTAPAKETSSPGPGPGNLLVPPACVPLKRGDFWDERFEWQGLQGRFKLTTMQDLVFSDTPSDQTAAPVPSPSGHASLAPSQVNIGATLSLSGNNSDYSICFGVDGENSCEFSLHTHRFYTMRVILRRVDKHGLMFNGKTIDSNRSADSDIRLRGPGYLGFVSNQNGRLSFYSAFSALKKQWEPEFEPVQLTLERDKTTLIVRAKKTQSKSSFCRVGTSPGTLSSNSSLGLNG